MATALPSALGGNAHQIQPQTIPAGTTAAANPTNAALPAGYISLGAQAFGMVTLSATPQTPQMVLAQQQNWGSDLYLLDYAVSASKNGPVTISKYKLDPNSLTLEAPTTVTTGAVTNLLASTDPYGAGLYVVSEDSPKPTGCSSSTANSLGLAGGPPANQLSQGAFTSFAVDRTGNFLYALALTPVAHASDDAGSIVAFRINPVGGGLTQIGTTVLNGGATTFSSSATISATGTLQGAISQ